MMSEREDKGSVTGWGAVRRSLLMAALVATMAMLSACGAGTISTFETLQFDENAKVADTQEHREVLEVVDAYRVALEKRDTDSLRNLISVEYYENAGTSATSEDDYGFNGVPKALERLGEAVRSIQFELVVKDVLIEGDRAFVTYEYLWNFRYEIGDKSNWESGRDINRMHLVRDQGGLWKISRGL